MEQAIGFPNYQPISRQQREFHASRARHKLLIGGYGGGKSYPAIHEFIFHCLANPGHHSMVMRNTWKDLHEQSWNDCLDLWEPAGIIKKKVFKPEVKLEVTLINDHLIMFKPLSSKRDNIKGAHLCQFYIDDPDVKKHQDVISFMMSRLRNPPHVKADRFQSIITANWEGRDWLWKTFMKGRKEGGDGEDLVEVEIDGEKKEIFSGKAFWMCPTSDNPTLHENYIADLAASHSAEWMDRYVFCKDVSRHSGLIYHDFDYERHYKSKQEVLKIPGLVRCLGVDVGGTHPTAVIDMCTDGHNIYVIDEWVKKNCKLSDLGGYLQMKQLEGHYRRFVIDPSSAKGEQTSNSSVKRELHRNYQISFENGNNNVDLGISFIQDMMLTSKNEVRFFIDHVRCPNLLKGIEIYRWEEPKNMDLDDMEYAQKPRKKNDDEMDAMRYGAMWCRKYIRDRASSIEWEKNRKNKSLEKYDKLPYYKNNRRMRTRQIVLKTYPQMGVSKERIEKILKGQV